MPDDTHPTPRHLVVRVRGHLDRRWSARLDGMSITPQPDGTTVLRGPAVDQAALHGLLQRLRDIGIPLVSLAEVDADAAAPEEHPLPTQEGA